MVIRRILGRVGANTIGRVLTLDVSRTTVCRWEQLFGATVLAIARAWYHRRQLELVRPVDSAAGTVHRAVTHVFAGDATNAMVWHRTKLHACRIQSTYDTEDVVAESTSDCQAFSQELLHKQTRQSRQRTFLTDLLEATQCSGVDTHALYLKSTND